MTIQNADVFVSIQNQGSELTLQFLGFKVSERPTALGTANLDVFPLELIQNV